MYYKQIYAGGYAISMDVVINLRWIGAIIKTILYLNYVKKLIF
jgi:hypothetical protein